MSEGNDRRSSEAVALECPVSVALTVSQLEVPSNGCLFIWESNGDNGMVAMLGMVVMLCIFKPLNPEQETAIGEISLELDVATS